MTRKKKKYRVINEYGDKILTARRGTFAGNKKHKIYGTLDCPSGLARMKKENRVFFTSRKAALWAGFRACKICKP